MKLKCLAIDDEPLALTQIANYIKRTSSLELVDTATSASEAYHILCKAEIDLMFVDINMPEVSGMDFVKSLKNKPGIVFTTAYMEYAAEGFKVDAIDYLLKPIGYEDFLRSVNRALQRLDSGETSGDQVKQKEDYLFIKSEYKLIRIDLNNIKYIEGMREYVRIHLTDQKPIMTLASIKKLEEKLPNNKFMRVHRSYIVNLKRITTIERLRIIFDDDVRIPVSDQYKDEFQNFVDKHFL